MADNFDERVTRYHATHPTMTRADAARAVFHGADVLAEGPRELSSYERAAAKRDEIQREATRLAEVQFGKRVTAYAAKHPELHRSVVLLRVLYGEDLRA